MKKQKNRNSHVILTTIIAEKNECQIVNLSRYAFFVMIKHIFY